jgi:Zn-dependent protease
MSIELNEIIGIVIVVGSILFSMTLHEAMHAFTSDYLGDDTARLSGRLSLNPLDHIDPFTTILMPVLLYLLIGIPFGAAKPVPFNPSRLRYDELGAALVGLAGPLTNLALAVVSGLWIRFVVGFDAGILTQGGLMFMLVNLGFFVFNMIPFPPLDGSRLMYALAPDSIRDFMRSIEAGGIASIGIFLVVFYTFLSPLLGSIIEMIASVILGVTFI